MKKIAIILLLMLSFAMQAQWIPLNANVWVNLNDVCCISEDFVIVVGDEGTILKTTDGGTNWQQKDAGTTTNLIKVQFVNPQIGFALGTNGALLKTTNGGENWTTLLADQTDTFATALSCANETVIYISQNYELKKSTDGGTTFQTMNTSIGRMQFIDEQLGYAIGDQSLQKTTDGGNTWTTVLTTNYVYDFFFYDENNGFINDSSGLSKTADGGLNFTLLDGFDTSINKLYATSPNIIWGLPVWCLLNFDPCYSIKGEIANSGTYQRTNGGLLFINALSFANPTKGYAVGESGQILKNNTGIDNLAVNDIARNEETFIYPNPASEKINLHLPENLVAPFQIEISDSLGNMVFAQTYQQENNIEIATCNFSKSIYFLKVTSQEKRQVHKLIIK